jgi:hypothetical protein
LGAPVRGTAELRIEVQAFIPQPAWVGDLWGGAPEENGAKAPHPADMAQRFEDHSDRLAAARGAAVNADVRGGLQKRGLRSGLCRDYHLTGH